MHRGQRSAVPVAIRDNPGMQRLHSRLVEWSVGTRHECSWAASCHLLKSSMHSSKTNSRFRRPPVISTRTPWATDVNDQGIGRVRRGPNDPCRLVHVHHGTRIEAVHQRQCLVLPPGAEARQHVALDPLLDGEDVTERVRRGARGFLHAVQDEDQPFAQLISLPDRHQVIDICRLVALETVRKIQRGPCQQSLGRQVERYHQTPRASVSLDCQGFAGHCELR